MQARSYVHYFKKLYFTPYHFNANASSLELMIISQLLVLPIVLPQLANINFEL